ncbi:adaptor protein [Bacillus sp. HMF5848]|uniref:adaptor protein MecA n=1 Tax=Bacillus sp. HMF5848 TaxID=2495421 RepID=UPI000F79457D|nr:adaptor protein MecA [Bacillus sp. HMF5848]RSK27459.1 adaptor protein [Bacillus sp. HMF5848]
MRLERISNNKVKVFISIDDLVKHGLTKEDIWDDSAKVHDFFTDMIDQAQQELGFTVANSLVVEIHSIQPHGMVIIVSAEIDDNMEDYFEQDYSSFFDLGNQQKQEEITFRFVSLEDVIQFSLQLINLVKHYNVTSSLYYFEGKYYMSVMLMSIDKASISALLSEYGEQSHISIHRLTEYGKTIMEQNAINQLYHYFNNGEKN